MMVVVGGCNFPQSIKLVFSQEAISDPFFIFYFLSLHYYKLKKLSCLPQKKKILKRTLSCQGCNWRGSCVYLINSMFKNSTKVLVSINKILNE